MAQSEAERIRNLPWKELIKYIDKHGIESPERKQAVHVLQLRLAIYTLVLAGLGILVTVLINIDKLEQFFK